MVFCVWIAPARLRGLGNRKREGRKREDVAPPFRPEIEKRPPIIRGGGRAGSADLVYCQRRSLHPRPKLPPAAPRQTQILDRGQTGDRTLAHLPGCRFFEIRPDKHTNLSSSLADVPPRGNADEVSAGGDRLLEKRPGSFFRNALPPPPPQNTASIMSTG